MAHTSVKFHTPTTKPGGSKVKVTLMGAIDAKNNSTKSIATDAPKSIGTDTKLIATDPKSIAVDVKSNVTAAKSISGSSLTNSQKIPNDGGRHERVVEEAKAAEGVLWQMAMSGDGWTEFEGLTDADTGVEIFWRDGSRNSENSPPPTAGVIRSDSDVDRPKYYKIWKCCAEVNATAEDVFRLMCDTGSMHKWNKDVTSYKILETIDNQTDVVQCLSATSASGMVSPRDFVILRRRSMRSPDHFIIADTGTKHPRAQNYDDGSVVRGWNGPGGFVIKKRHTKPESSWVCWILNKDLRGWLPRSVVDNALSSVLLDWVKNLRIAVATPHSRQPIPTAIAVKGAAVPQNTNTTTAPATGTPLVRRQLKKSLDPVQMPSAASKAVGWRENNKTNHCRPTPNHPTTNNGITCPT